MEEKDNVFTETDESIPDGIDLFGDGDTNYSQEEEPEEMTEAEQEDTQAEEAQQEHDIFTITFNGQEKQLTRDEMIQYAQKGMNYDHVKEKADRADSNQKAADLIAAFAENAGMSVEDYLKTVSDEISGKEVRELTEQGMSESLAKELLTLRREAKVNSKAKEEADRQQQLQKGWDEWAEHLGGWDKAPFHDAKDIPDGMRQELEAGKSPLMAWLLYNEKANAEKLAAATAAAKNKQQAPGSASSTLGSRKEDPFLRGFLD